MADSVIKYIVDSLFSNNNITAKVGVRVYEGHIAAVPQPVYPCITIERQVPGRSLPFVPLSEYDLVITAFSDISYDEADTLLEEVKNSIAYTSSSDVTSGWAVCPVATPMQDSQRVEKIVFYLKMVYRVYKTG